MKKLRRSPDLAAIVLSSALALLAVPGALLGAGTSVALAEGVTEPPASTEATPTEPPAQGGAPEAGWVPQEPGSGTASGGATTTRRGTSLGSGGGGSKSTGSSGQTSAGGSSPSGSTESESSAPPASEAGASAPATPSEAAASGGHGARTVTPPVKTVAPVAKAVGAVGTSRVVSRPEVLQAPTVNSAPPVTAAPKGARENPSGGSSPLPLLLALALGLACVGAAIGIRRYRHRRRLQVEADEWQAAFRRIRLEEAAGTTAARAGRAHPSGLDSAFVLRPDRTGGEAAQAPARAKTETARAR